jgi:hypothetical protein
MDDIERYEPDEIAGEKRQKWQTTLLTRTAK